MAQIQYFVYQDLQNIMNLLYSLKAVQEFFKNQQDHPMITVCKNKVLLQLNLSNAIHYDLNSSKESLSIASKERENVKNIIKQLEPELKEFENYIEFYQKNCLGKNIHLEQNRLEQSDLKVNFNQSVLSKIIPSIQTVDSELLSLSQQQNHPIPNAEKIRNKAIQYLQLTKQSLNNNFQNEQNQIQVKNQNKEELQKDEYEELFNIFQNQIEDKFENEVNQSYMEIFQSLNKKDAFKSSKQLKKEEIEYAKGLFGVQKIKDNHKQYFKFKLFEFFIMFSKQKNQKDLYQKDLCQQFTEYFKKNKLQLTQLHQQFIKYLYFKQDLLKETSYKAYKEFLQKVQEKKVIK